MGKKNYFVYYATEENAFETEKYGTFTESEALAVAKKILEEYDDEALDDLEFFRKNMNYGCSVHFEDKYKGYVMFVGIAPKEKTESVENEIAEMRNEILDMFDEEEEYGELD